MRSRAGTFLFDPLLLGAALIEWWDLRTSGSLTLGGSNEISNVAGKKSVYNLSQATGSLQAIWDASGFAKFDATDDYFELTLTSAVAQGQMYWCTPYGWYKSAVANWTVGTHYINGANVSQIIFVNAATITSEQRTLLETYIGTTEYWFITKTNDTTIYNRIDNNPNVDYTLNYIGANAATYNLASSQAGATVDVGAQGLTAPVHMLWPIGIATDSTITYCYSSGNAQVGLMPDSSGNTALLYWSMSDNKFCGPLRNLPTTTISYNAHINNFTGDIPSFAGLSAITTFFAHTNKFNGYAGGGVSNTLGTIRLENNLFTATAVNAILADVRAAGRVAGTRVLNLGGTGNAAPTGQGIVDRDYLTNTMLWTVTTN